MEQKNKQKAIFLVILIFITAFVYWFSNRERSFSVDKNLFRLSDYQNIDKVVFESGEKKVELTFNGSRWKVNGDLNADRNMIKVLFATFQQAEPKRPVTNTVQDSLKNYLETKGVKVSLFSRGNLEQQFLAGGNDLKTQAYFKKPDGNEVFIMNIPGYRVYVSGIFELSENQWRDKLIFGFNWQNFQSLGVEFPDKPSENFHVSMHDNVFGIEELTKTDTAKLNTFLDNVSLLTANEFLEPGSYTDSLKEVKPFMKISVKDIGKKEYSLELFRAESSLVPGIVQDNDAVTFSRLKIQPIIRPKSFFKSE